MVGTVSIDLVGYSKLTITNKEISKEEIPGPLQKVAIEIGEEISHEFELREGENFYYIITQDIGGERHVIKG